MKHYIRGSLWEQHHWGEHNRSKCLIFTVMAGCGKYLTCREVYERCYGIIPFSTIKNSLPRWSQYRHPYLLTGEKTRWVKSTHHSTTIASYKINVKGKKWLENVPLWRKQEVRDLLSNAAKARMTKEDVKEVRSTATDHSPGESSKPQSSWVPNQSDIANATAFKKGIGWWLYFPNGRMKFYQKLPLGVRNIKG